LNYLCIPKKDRKNAKKYHYVKRAVSILLSRDFTGIAKPEIKRGLSNASIKAKNGSALFKINGFSPEKTTFINYPGSCHNDQKKLNFLKTQLARGNINIETFDDLSSVLYIPEKDPVIAQREIRKEQTEKAIALIDEVFSDLLK
jgi:hypothetical protein